MLYLCGWSEPESVWMAINTGGVWVTSLFVPPQDTKAEIWEGRRAGPEGAAKIWPVDEAHSILDLNSIVSSMLDKYDNVYAIRGLNTQIDSLLDVYEKEVLDPKPHLDSLRVIKSLSLIHI